MEEGARGRMRVDEACLGGVRGGYDEVEKAEETWSVKEDV